MKLEDLDEVQKLKSKLGRIKELTKNASRQALSITFHDWGEYSASYCRDSMDRYKGIELAEANILKECREFYLSEMKKELESLLLELGCELEDDTYPITLNSESDLDKLVEEKIANV